MRSTTIGVVVPLPLLDWIDEAAKAKSLTRSRFIAQMLLDASGLDLALKIRGRCVDTERKRATREIAAATGQVPIGSPNLGW